jgi:SAM-dependent methyltransferase
VVAQDLHDDIDMEAAIELEMGRLITDMGASLELMLISLGTRSGLWTALAGAGPQTAEQVAGRVAVDPALVREWLRAQAASRYLTYDPGSETFELGDATAAVLVHGPGQPLVEACMSMFVSMAESYEQFSEAFTSGQGFGWHQRTEDYWHGADALTRTALPPELIAGALAQVPGLDQRLEAGGTVVDVGCGYGAPTIAIAAQHPASRVLGIDYHDASVMHARTAAAEAGVGNVRFEVGTATGLAASDVDLVTFFDSLHDLGDPRAALVRAREALGPDGVVVLFEPLGADRVADNLNPGGRMFYAVSTLICTPNAVSQRTATSSPPLGTLAGEQGLRAVAAEAGFTRVRRIELPAPLNLVLELRP